MDFLLLHEGDDVPQRPEVHVLDDLLDETRVVVAPVELHQLVAHLSREEGPQIVQKLVSLLPVRSVNGLDRDNHFNVIELVHRPPDNPCRALTQHLHFLDS